MFSCVDAELFDGEQSHPQGLGCSERSGDRGSHRKDLRFRTKPRCLSQLRLLEEIIGEASHQVDGPRIPLPTDFHDSYGCVCVLLNYDNKSF
jgi:hypothetical protein